MSKSNAKTAPMNNQTERSSMKNQPSFLRDAMVAALLVVFVLLCRLTIDIPNFQPVMAVALFSGFFFSRTWMAIAVPAAGMALSDILYLGGYQWQIMCAVYLATFCPLLMGCRMRRGQSSNRLWMLGSSLVAAVIFFVVTNLAFWWYFGWYDKTITGLASCFLMAVPFFKWTLFSNLLFSSGLFAFHAFLGWTHASRRAALIAN